MRKDPVTPETRAAVLKRDGGCVAKKLIPQESVKCWGRLTLDHVKDNPTMSKRAPSDLAHLATLCQGHTEDGRKAGFQWNTANRPILREYLLQVTPSSSG